MDEVKSMPIALGVAAVRARSFARSLHLNQSAGCLHWCAAVTRPCSVNSDERGGSTLAYAFVPFRRITDEPSAWRDAPTDSNFSTARVDGGAPLSA